MSEHPTPPTQDTPDSTSDSQLTIPTTIPPKWVNAAMKWMLKTPVLQTFAGKAMALVTFTGHKSGKRYTTPVSYLRRDNTVFFTSKKVRAWWKNFQTPTEVKLRLAGKNLHGQAVAHTDESMLPGLTAFFDQYPRMVKAYGVRTGADGAYHAGDLRALVDHLVVIEVTLAP